MGHETLKIILERDYSYIGMYQRDDGAAFMENVYNASLLKTEAEVWEGWNDWSRDTEGIPRGLPRGGLNILRQIYSKKRRVGHTI